MTFFAKTLRNFSQIHTEFFIECCNFASITICGNPRGRQRFEALRAGRKIETTRQIFKAVKIILFGDFQENNFLRAFAPIKSVSENRRRALRW